MDDLWQSWDGGGSTTRMVLLNLLAVFDTIGLSILLDYGEQERETWY